MKTLRLRLLAAALLLLALPAAANDWPPAKGKVLTPDDWENPSNQPNDLGNDWNKFSFVKKSVQSNAGFRKEEIPLGSGMSADKAWQLSIGNARTTIAVVDSGFRWGETDLVNKWRLNKGELSPPQDAAGAVCATCADKWDVNGDGGFTVADYTDCKKGEQPTPDRIVDKRLTSRADKGDVNRNGILDPQDLIAIFSDKTDGDGNGYVDDICGWDFLWNDNDAFDDVETGGDGYSHGTGQARGAAAEGNNGRGGIGVCPDCLVLPLRGADSFVGDSNNFAEAVIYATDNHVAALEEALGTLDNTPYMQAALDYAYVKGMPLIASAADETSFHHNWPGSGEHTLYVHAIMFDGKDSDSKDTTTFLNFNNCTNWGAHLALSIPGTGCSSEATSLAGGQAGLIQAYAGEVGIAPALSSEEVFQIMARTADDIDVPESAVDRSKYLSYPGWDPHFGYGRNNVHKSLLAVKDGKIPPEVDVISPRWFQVIDPAKGAIDIVGSIAAKRASGGFDYTVEVATGLYPRESEFKVIASGKGKEPLLGVSLAKAELAGLFPDIAKAPSTPHEFQVYVRLKVTAHYGGAVGDVPGEFRKAFFVHRDPLLLPAFPIHLGASGESSPKLADLDGDGKDEIILATSDGYLHVFTSTGAELAGFPVHASPIANNVAHAGAPAFKGGGLKADGYYQAFVATSAVGDIDGDGKPEIVASSFDGEIYAWNTRGELLKGFPITATDAGTKCYFETITGCTAAGIKELAPQGSHSVQELREVERGFFSSPVLYDLDGDGKREIIEGGLDGFLYAFKSDGTAQPGFPVELRDAAGGERDSSGNLFKTRGRILSTPTVGDIDGDGKPEILIGTNEVYENEFGARGYLVKGSGAPSIERSAEAYFPGWPLKLRGLRTSILPFVGRGVPTNGAMIDADNDGKLDLLNIQTMAAPGEFFDVTGRKLMTTNNSNFGEKANTADAPAWSAINSGALGDIDGDGYPDFVNGLVGVTVLGGATGGKKVPFDHSLGAWALGRQFKNDKQRLLDEPSYVAEASFIRGFPQVIDDHQFLTNYIVADVDGDGKNEAIGGSGGYTIHAFNLEGARPAGWPKFTGGWVITTPAVGDVDGDGLLDMVAVTREGWLWAWSTGGKADQKLWWDSYHHDAMNTGNTLTPLPQHKRPAVDLTPRGPPAKGCGCSSTEGLGALGLLALSTLRRRKGGR